MPMLFDENNQIVFTARALTAREIISEAIDEMDGDYYWLPNSATAEERNYYSEVIKEYALGLAQGWATPFQTYEDSLATNRDNRLSGDVSDDDFLYNELEIAAEFLKHIGFIRPEYRLGQEDEDDTIDVAAIFKE